MRFCAFLGVLFVSTGCLVEQTEPAGTRAATGTAVEAAGNPYSVANMRLAYAALGATRATSGIDPKEIIATHRYVRFTPTNPQEEARLLADSLLDLYPYRLDSQDHTPQDGVYYASVPEGYALPDSVTYELIEDLFIPDEYGIDGQSRTRAGADMEFIERLVDKALEITGNAPEPRTNGATRASKWRPSGYITYYDDVQQKTIGIRVEVKANRWFTTHRGRPDETTGYYQCDGRFERPADYSFDLKRYEFDVTGEQAVFVGFGKDNVRGAWSYHFERSKNEYYYYAATIFRAAHHYYYKAIAGLRRPPKNGFLKAKMKIHAFNDNSWYPNFESDRRILGLGSMVHMYGPGKATDEIYGETIHELAHASHWGMATDRSRHFTNGEATMKESWCNGVQWQLTRMVYPNYNGIVVHWQSKSPYTAFVIDLMDGNDAGYNKGKTAAQGDLVEGYTIRQIEDALRGCKNGREWKENLKKKFDNATEKHVDALYDLWW